MQRRREGEEVGEVAADDGSACKVCSNANRKGPRGEWKDERRENDDSSLGGRLLGTCTEGETGRQTDSRLGRMCMLARTR